MYKLYKIFHFFFILSYHGHWQLSFTRRKCHLNFLVWKLSIVTIDSKSSLLWIKLTRDRREIQHLANIIVADNTCTIQTSQMTNTNKTAADQLRCFKLTTTQVTQQWHTINIKCYLIAIKIHKSTSFVHLMKKINKLWDCIHNCIIF